MSVIPGFTDLTGSGCDAAVRLHIAAIARRLRNAEPDGETAYPVIHRQAIDLKEAGEPGKASRVLNTLAARWNCKSGWSEQGQDLIAVLLDAAARLCADEEQRSAQDAAAHAESIASRNERD